MRRDNEGLEGRAVVVLGANGGLGRAFSEALAQRGARPMLAARDPGTLATLASELRATAVPVDVADSRSLDGVRDAALAALGRIDVVVNAAGVCPRGPLARMSEAAVRRAIDVNLLGPMLITRSFLPALVRQGAGVLAHVGGVLDGRLALPYHAAYCATRAGLYAFAEAANRELAQTGVNVLYFSPAPTDTEAERPFLPVWRGMGVPIVSLERVAQELVAAILRRDKVRIMGGVATRLFAKINAALPAVADAMYLRKHQGTLASLLEHRSG